MHGFNESFKPYANEAWTTIKEKFSQGAQYAAMPWKIYLIGTPCFHQRVLDWFEGSWMWFQNASSSALQDEFMFQSFTALQPPFSCASWFVAALLCFFVGLGSLFQSISTNSSTVHYKWYIMLLSEELHLFQHDTSELRVCSDPRLLRKHHPKRTCPLQNLLEIKQFLVDYHLWFPSEFPSDPLCHGFSTMPQRISTHCSSGHWELSNLCVPFDTTHEGFDRLAPPLVKVFAKEMSEKFQLLRLNYFA